MAEAEALHRRAMSMKARLLGDDHQDVALSVHNLAALLFDAGRRDEARALSDRAVSLFGTQLAPDHPKLVAALELLDEIRRSGPREVAD